MNILSQDTRTPLLTPIARAIQVTLVGLSIAQSSAIAATIEVTSNTDD